MYISKWIKISINSDTQHDNNKFGLLKKKLLMFLWIINSITKFHKMTLTLQCMNLYSTSTKFFNSCYYIRMIQFFFNSNRIYLSDWGPAKNHASIQPPSQSLQIFQTILQQAVTYPGQRPFNPRAIPHLLRHQLNSHNKTSLKRVWFNGHFPVKDTECTVIHL